jgi:hypothetical protein
MVGISRLWLSPDIVGNRGSGLTYRPQAAEQGPEWVQISRSMGSFVSCNLYGASEGIETTLFISNNIFFNKFISQTFLNLI